jgi:hypothetical protein
MIHVATSFVVGANVVRNSVVASRINRSEVDRNPPPDVGVSTRQNHEASMSIHPVYLLLFVTLLLVAAFAVWNLLSTRRQQKYGTDNISGPGGKNDPLR